MATSDSWYYDPVTRAYRFFTPNQARAVVAAAERIFPADALGPGATEIGVVDYVDAAVAGDPAGVGEL
jgi:gluconate 2-dehydrogenase gamma chain